MVTSAIFLKWRAFAFSCVSFLSLLWIILLCIIAYGRWDISDHPEKAFIAVLLLTNTINLLMLPILILREFRAWLDGARLLFLLTTNIGVAAAFTYWNPRFQCLDQTADQEGVCQLINFYILMANWVNPALLIAYSCCLAFLVWWRSRQPPSISASKAGFVDEEASIGQPSMVPTIFPEIAQRKPLTITIPTTPGRNMPLKTSSREWYSREQENYHNGGRKESSGEESTISRPSTARLSKQQRMPLY